MGPQSHLSREEKLLTGLDVVNSVGLEIGALDKPFLRPPSANIRFVDHADQAALRVKYAGDPYVVAEDLVPVDAVWGERTLQECFPGEKFDYVIASHVIEHVPDMIGWLSEIADILRLDGRLILAIPDRRYSYDYLRRETSLAQLIDAHLRVVRRPTPGQVFDFNANSVDFGPVQAWTSPKPYVGLASFVSRAQALEAARESRDGRYIDGHCSVFTARSLLLLLSDLLELGLLRYRLERFHVADEGSAEMSLVLCHLPADAATGPARDAFLAMLDSGTDSLGLTLDDAPEDSCNPRIAALENALREMQASTSWRITAPLRAVARRLRR